MLSGAECCAESFAEHVAKIAGAMSKQKLHELREKAKGLEPIVRIGKNGLSEGAVEQVRRALMRRKLVKVKLLQAFAQENDREKAAQELESRTGARMIDMIGFNITLYREGGVRQAEAAGAKAGTGKPRSPSREHNNIYNRTHKSP